MAYHEYFRDDSDPVLSAMIEALDTAIMDVSGAEHEELGVKLLVEAKQKYGANKLLSSLQQRMYKNDNFYFELYWFARAGIIECLPLLKKNFKSDDIDCLTTTALSLAHLGQAEGFEFIESIFSGNHDFVLEDDPWWYFGDSLEHISDPRAKELVAKYGPAT